MGKRGRNNGKKHEKKVDAAVRKLYPLSKVETDVKRDGILSQGKRQIDTLLHGPRGLTDFEAKDYKRNVGIDTIAEFGFKVLDEQVPYGVMVSASPYAETAINTARYYGIRPTHLIDTSDKENRFKVAQKTVVEDTKVVNMLMGIQDRGTQPISLPANKDGSLNVEALTLENSEGERLPAYQVFKELWNQNECPDTEGTHVISLDDQKVVMTDGSVVAVSRLHFEYTVRIIYRKGEWPVEKTLGFYDASEGSLTTNNVTSSTLSAKDMNTWQEITKEEADRPEYGMRLVVKSMLPDELPPKTSAI